MKQVNDKEFCCLHKLIVIANVDHCHDAECGGLQTGEGGLLSSPNYPDAYPSPSRCAWLLEAPAGHTITVRLQLFFTRLAAGDKPLTSAQLVR